MPPIPGIDLENVFKLQTLSDMDSIIAAIKNLRIKKAAIIGGGFIGIEAAENLAQLGLDIHLIEADNQIMPPIDPEMAEIIQDKMLNNGIDLMLKTKAAAIEKDNEGLAVRFVGGSSLVCGLAVLAIGVRPNVSLARDAGLEIGAIGGIKTDERMRTSDSSIFAVGDAIEIYNPVTGLPAFIPLAGPANKQGRIAADQVFGRDSVYEGTIGTSICKVFNTAVAATGASEKLLKRLGKKFQKSYTHSLSHAGYYPGASPISIKIIFDPDSGQILGAQAIGADGADKRIDVITTAIKCGRTVFDLENLELGYAPPYGSAKDPVNIAGSVAANIIRGDHRIIHADDIIERDKASTFILDVRTAFEFQNGHIDGSVNIPLNELRDHLDEIPVAKQILVYCQVGLRGYIAQRILSQRGFDAANLSGGYTTFITRMESLQ
jgi:NADPH-dependent 2,4-dienoyl-CoA reductase/sulfur reductase-like enzyme/rhodanese-related sulfurtransferase